MAPSEPFRVLKWYGRLGKIFQPSELQASLLWAAVVGVAGGFIAIGFRFALQGLLWCWTRHTGSLEQVAAQLAWWQRLVIPAGGGWLAGLVLHWNARFAHGQRSNDYMEAVAVHKGVLSVRQSLVKGFSSLITVSSGGSIGREGAMVQLSAMVASWLGRRTIKLSIPRLRLLVACGAAAGIAAVYNVTIAGALFVAEVLLGSIAMESLGPLLVAAVASALVTRYLAGQEAYFTSPAFKMASPWELLPCLGLGVIVGTAAPGYIRLLRKSEDWFTRLAPKVYWRMALGGLAVGGLAAALPEIWGNGRTMVNLVLHNPWPWTFLAVILICKVMATAATTGSGAVGGVFTPTMFTGAMIGCLVGHATQAVWPGPTAGPQAYALLGMGGFLTAATRAPLMSMLMLFEMTLDYGLVIPLMIVSVTAYYTARSLQSDSIYSEALRRKQPHTGPAEKSELRVNDLLKPPTATVTENAPFAEVAKRFAEAPYRHLPVVTLQNQLRGIIVLSEVENQLQHDPSSEWTTAAGLMRTDVQMVTPETNLQGALETFRRFHGERLPVVKDMESRTLLGYISKTDVLLALAHGIQGGPH